MTNKPVYTVHYFINGTRNTWKSGISTDREASKIANMISLKFPLWDVTIGFGVDQSSCVN